MTCHAPAWTNTSVQGDSIIQDNGTNIGFSATPSTGWNKYTAIQINYDAVIAAGTSWWAGGIKVGTNFHGDQYAEYFNRASRYATQHFQSSQGGRHSFKVVAAGGTVGDQTAIVNTKTYTITIAGSTATGNNFIIYGAANNNVGSTFVATSTGNITGAGRAKENIVWDIAMTILKEGKVGIGTASPVAKLEIAPAAGNFNSTYNDYSGVGLFITGNGEVGEGNYGPGLVFGSADIDNDQYATGKHAAISAVQTGADENQVGMAFWTHESATQAGGLVEQVRITNAGNVGIGTTDPSTRLDVRDDGQGLLNIETTTALNASYLSFKNTAGTAYVGITNSTGGTIITGGTAYALCIRPPSGKVVQFGKGDGTGPTATIDNSGNLSILGTLTEASSLAIKENIETYSPSLEMISKIRPVRFNKKKSKKKEIGLVADELVEMFPELVEMDEKGNPSGVNYSRAVAVLLHGFKELYKEVKELKEKI